MAQDPKKRQKVLVRKAVKEKQRKEIWRKQEMVHRQVSNPRALFRSSGKWPLHELLLSKTWQDSMDLTQILVARRSTQGQIAMGSFLVDQGCLGVKNADAKLFNYAGEYDEFRERFASRQPMVAGDLNLAAKILREAIRYARDLGFEPHPDFAEAMPILEGADPDACPLPIPLGGRDGKPFFMNGPYDNVTHIMNHLMKRLGPDGFTYLVPIDPGTEFIRSIPDEGWERIGEEEV